MIGVKVFAQHSDRCSPVVHGKAAFVDFTVGVENETIVADRSAVIQLGFRELVQALKGDRDTVTMKTLHRLNVGLLKFVNRADLGSNRGASVSNRGDARQVRIEASWPSPLHFEEMIWAHLGCLAGMAVLFGIVAGSYAFSPRLTMSV